LLLGDFFVTGDHTLGELAAIYGLTIAPEEAETTLADYFYMHNRRASKQGDALPLGPIELVAHQVTDGRVTSIGLRLADEEADEPPATWRARMKRFWRRLLARIR
jgi:potassium/hydrogen antiporter